jgi:hypothetical protein
MATPVMYLVSFRTRPSSPPTIWQRGGRTERRSRTYLQFGDEVALLMLRLLLEPDAFEQ